LKEVNDEAMHKLATYRQEHQQMTERAQQLYRSASRASKNSMSAPRKHQMDDKSNNSSNIEDLSFLSAPRKRDNSRNRFFTPRAIKELPPTQIPIEEPRLEE
jgi:hypothetical protein